MWVDVEHPINAILDICLLLLKNGHPVIVTGGLETRIILRNLQTKWQPNSVLKLNFGSEMSMDNCMSQLTQHLSRKGENHLQPSEKGQKLLWMVRQLETSRVQPEGCLMSMLCDIAKNKTIYRRGICGSFFLSLSFSRSQVVMKKSSNDTFFLFKNLYYHLMFLLK